MHISCIWQEHVGICGAIAQLGERYNGIVEVVGSIPIGSTNLLLAASNRLACAGNHIIDNPESENW